MKATDIISIWEQHLGSELFAKDVDATMATMRTILISIMFRP